MKHKGIDCIHEIENKTPGMIKGKTMTTENKKNEGIS